ncbi:20448_t:CDS:1, partial [Dentiscutata erythropus]
LQLGNYQNVFLNQKEVLWDFHSGNNFSIRNKATNKAEVFNKTCASGYQ